MRLGPTYLVIEQSPALSSARHDRLAPGLNHLAFHVRDADEVDRLVERAAGRGGGGGGRSVRWVAK